MQWNSLKTYWYPISLVLIVVGLAFLFSQKRDQVLAQQADFFNGVAPGQPGGLPSGTAQVIVRQQVEPPKTVVDITPMDLGGRKVNVVTTVDTETKRITVHHVDAILGTIKWLGTRNIQQDLLVDEFNAVPPTPREVGESLRHLSR